MTIQLNPNRTVYIYDSIGNVGFNSELIISAYPILITNNTVQSSFYSQTYLPPGYEMISQNGMFTMTFQNDCNLVLRDFRGLPYWSSF